MKRVVYEDLDREVAFIKFLTDKIWAREHICSLIVELKAETAVNYVKGLIYSHALGIHNFELVRQGTGSQPPSSGAQSLKLTSTCKIYMQRIADIVYI